MHKHFSLPQGCSHTLRISMPHNISPSQFCHFSSSMLAALRVSNIILQNLSISLNINYQYPTLTMTSYVLFFTSSICSLIPFRYLYYDIFVSLSISDPSDLWLILYYLRTYGWSLNFPIVIIIYSLIPLSFDTSICHVFKPQKIYHLFSQISNTLTAPSIHYCFIFLKLRIALVRWNITKIFFTFVVFLLGST